MPRRAAFIAITVEQQAAIDARKYQPGFGADASPPMAFPISVTMVSRAGPITLHFKPSVKVAVSGAFSGLAAMAAATVPSAIAIGEIVDLPRWMASP